MSMKISKERSLLLDISILLPFILVFLGAIFLKVYPPLGRLLKFSSFIYMLVYVIFIHKKLPKNPSIAFLLFLPFFLYGIAHSFNLSAAIEDGLRYLFPIVALFYGYSIRKHLDLIIKFIIVFLLLNFIVQIFQYYFWSQGMRQWFYHVTPRGAWYYNAIMGMLRASGLVVYFAVFGYINMISFFLIQRYYQGRYKKWFLGISLLLLFASMSTKTIITFFIILIFIYYKKILNLITAGIIFAIMLMMAFPVQTKGFIDNLMYRFDAYLLMKKPSVRAETYILMWKDIFNFDLFGHGVGSFGGPASLKYNSPYYQEVHFTWPDTFWMKLTTVDTFPPHVFIELGIIGGLLFFLVLTSPIIKRHIPVMVLIIYFSLFFDMLFTFSLASLEYMMYSLVLIYPVIYYEYHVKQNSTND